MARNKAQQDELIDAVRYYRELGFFQHRQDQGTRIDGGGQLGFAQVPHDLLLASYGLMTDSQVADTISSHCWKERGKDLDLGAPGGSVQLVEYDPYRVWRFDTESSGPGEDAYVDAIHALGRISRGAFVPKEVREEWESAEGPVNVNFVADGKRHSWRLEPHGDWMDTSFLQRINALLTRTPYQVCTLETTGQDVVAIFLTPEEKAKLGRDQHWRFVD